MDVLSVVWSSTRHYGYLVNDSIIDTSQKELVSFTLNTAAVMAVDNKVKDKLITFFLNHVSHNRY